MKEYGPALRLARERRGLTQTQVMELTGINNKTLSGYENGVSQPDLQTLSVLLRLYRASADQLLELSGPPATPPLGGGAAAQSLPPPAQAPAGGADPGAGDPPEASGRVITAQNSARQTSFIILEAKRSFAPRSLFGTFSR